MLFVTGRVVVGDRPALAFESRALVPKDLNKHRHWALMTLNVATRFPSNDDGRQLQHKSPDQYVSFILRNLRHCLRLCHGRPRLHMHTWGGCECEDVLKYAMVRGNLRAVQWLCKTLDNLSIRGLMWAAEHANQPHIVAWCENVAEPR